MPSWTSRRERCWSSILSSASWSRVRAFAFRDADGDYFFARITSTGRARKTVVNRDKCTIIGRVVSWTAETRPVLH